MTWKSKQQDGSSTLPTSTKDMIEKFIELNDRFNPYCIFSNWASRKIFGGELGSIDVEDTKETDCLAKCHNDNCK